MPVEPERNTPGSGAHASCRCAPVAPRSARTRGPRARDCVPPRSSRLHRVMTADRDPDPRALRAPARMRPSARGDRVAPDWAPGIRRLVAAPAGRAAPARPAPTPHDDARAGRGDRDAAHRRRLPRAARAESAGRSTTSSSARMPPSSGTRKLARAREPVVTEADRGARGQLGLVPPAGPPTAIPVEGEAPPEPPDAPATTLNGWTDVKPTLGSGP